MRNRLGKWMMLSCIVIGVLTGCRMSQGTSQETFQDKSPVSASPAVASSTSATPASPPAESPVPDVEASIIPADDVQVQGTVPAYQLDASYFADSATGWLVAETMQNKLTLLHTKDGGNRWDAKTLPGDRGDAVYFTGEKNGFAWVRSDCKAAGGGGERCKQRLLHTIDGGDRWTVVWESADETETFTVADLAFPGGAAGYALTPQGKVLVSHNGGRTWKAAPVGFNAAFRVEHMRFISASTGWAVGTVQKKGSDGQMTVSLQVWQTQDAGAHWRRQYQQTGNGLGSGGIDFYDKRNGYFLLGNYDEMTGRIMHTTDGGAHWQEAGPLAPARPTPMGIRLTSASSGWIPLSVGAGPIDGGLLHFTKGGDVLLKPDDGVWSVRDAVPTGSGTGWAIADVVPGARATVLKTANDGKSWRQTWPQPHPVADVQFIDQRRGYGIGRESEPGAFMATDDGGVTWTVISDLGLNGVRLYFADRQHGWVLGTNEHGTKPYVLETKDGGKTWRTAAASLPGWTSMPQSLDLKFFSETYGKLAIHDVDGVRVLRTEDAGRTWQVQTVFRQENTLLAVALAGENDLRQLEMVTGRDKTEWLTFSKLDLADQSKHPLAKLSMDGTPMGILSLSDKVTAVFVDRLSPGKIEMHLLLTQDGGGHWTDQAFPADGWWTTPQRFGATGEASWWLLMSGHLLRTNDAGHIWTVIY